MRNETKGTRYDASESPTHAERSCEHLCASEWEQHGRVSADIRDTSHVPEFLHPTRWIPRDLFSDRRWRHRAQFTVVPRRTAPDSLLTPRRSLSEVHGCPPFKSDATIDRCADRPIENARRRTRADSGAVRDRSRDFQTYKRTPNVQLAKRYSRAIKHARFKSIFRPRILYARYSSKVHTCVSKAGTLENWIGDFHDVPSVNGYLIAAKRFASVPATFYCAFYCWEKKLKLPAYYQHENSAKIENYASHLHARTSPRHI